MNHKEFYFQGFQNLKLYSQYFLPQGAIRAILLVMHGLAEHSGRYNNLANYFIPKGYAICTFDLRGHGKSGGTPGYVNKFADYLKDLDIFFKVIHREFKEQKIFLVGHSMGGTIATTYAVFHQKEFAGLVLSAPVLAPGKSITRQQIFFARLLSVILPKMGVAPLAAGGVSRDPAVVKAYVGDPLVYHGKISARLGAELISEMERYLPLHIGEIALPLLVMFGSEDRLSNPVGGQSLFDGVKSSDKTLKFYAGLRHEIYNEPDRDKVFADVEQWLNAHL